MKKVVSKSDVAHLWANKIQDEARNAGGNFYFNKNIIYSYGTHFPIAKHITNERGENAVLFTERVYGNTTAGHIWTVFHAARHLNIIYCYNPESTHEQNFSSWVVTAKEIAAKLLKAKKPEIYLSQLETVKQKSEKYADFFNLVIPQDLQDVVSIKDKKQYAEFYAKEIEYKIAAEKKAQLALKAKHKKELSKWLKGEGYRLFTHNGYDYLRLRNDRVETSQAVQIPLELAKRLWIAVRCKTLAVGDKVLDFTVNEVGKDIKIGCHTFQASYLVKFGEKIFN